MFGYEADLHLTGRFIVHVALCRIPAGHLTIDEWRFSWNMCLCPETRLNTCHYYSRVKATKNIYFKVRKCNCKLFLRQEINHPSPWRSEVCFPSASRVERWYVTHCFHHQTRNAHSFPEFCERASVCIRTGFEPAMQFAVLYFGVMCVLHRNWMNELLLYILPWSHGHLTAAYWNESAMGAQEHFRHFVV